MAFHDIRAYFTGFNYEPDPDPQRQEPDAAPPPIGLQSIVETIVREKVGQEPEEQLSTAEGDTTFADLIEQHEEESVAGPEPMPSVLDAIPVDAPGGSVDLPAERIVENAEEPALGPPPDDGAAPGGIGGAEDGAADMAGDATDAADVRDRLGLDSLFGPQQDGAQQEEPQEGGMFGGPPQEAMGDMLGGPGYDQIVEQAIGYGGEEAGEPRDEGYGADEGPAPEDEGEALEGVEDLLPEEDEVLGEGAYRPPSDDRGFLKSILRAPERRAAAAARRLAGVTINIGIDGEDEDVSVGMTGGPEGTDFDFEAEASAAARLVLASDVTINIDIGGGPDEPDIEGPEDLPSEPWEPELEAEPEEDVGGAPMSDEEAIEGLTPPEEAVEGLEAKPEKGQGKQDAMERFDELDDLGDVFKPGAEPASGESGETKQLGV
jgi:hypothetical protein